MEPVDTGDRRPTDAAPRRLAGALTAILVTAVLTAGWVVRARVLGRLPVQMAVLVVEPASWLVPGAIAYLAVRRHLEPVPRATRPAATQIALQIASIQIGLGVILGVAFGFRRASYEHDAAAIATNLGLVLALAVSQEGVRSVLIRRFAAVSPQRAFYLVWIGLWIVGVTSPELRALRVHGNVFAEVGTVLLPGLAVGLVATSLVARGGAIASMAYVVPLLAFERLAPVIPDPPWVAASLLAVVLPLVGLRLLEGADEIVGATAEPRDVERQLRHRDRRWAALALTALLVAGINGGLFGARAVVVTGISMEPALHTGDVVVVYQVPIDSLQVGDIIRFHQGSIAVVHRIVEIRSGPEPIFITRGDNNEADDPPIVADAIEGRVVSVVPKVGWPAVWMRWILGEREGSTS